MVGCPRVGWLLNDWVGCCVMHSWLWLVRWLGGWVSEGGLVAG